MQSRFVTRRKMLGTALSGVGAVALAACGGGDNKDTSAPATSTGNPAGATTGTQAPGRTGPVGTMSLAVDTLQDESLDLARFSAGQQLNQMLLVNDTLVRRDKDGKLVPGLAKSWRTDDKGWEFDLNENAKYHDGSPVVADDVGFMVERMLAADSKNFLAGDIRPVLAGVEVTGPNKIRFNTKEPFPLMLTVAWGIGPQSKAYFTKVGADAAQANYLGSGPFKLKQHTKGQSMTFESVQDFYDAARRPRIREVTYRIIPDAGTRLSALTTGEVDGAILGYPEAKKIRDGDKIKVAQSKAAGGRHLIVHDLVLDGNSPLKDLRARRALLLAIDRAAIIKTIFSGFGDPMITPFFPNTVGYDASLKPVPFDPKEAKQLLSAAGVPDGYELTLNTYGTGTTPEDEYPAIASYWQQVGLKVTIKQQETLAYLDDLKNRKLRGVGNIQYSSAVSGIDGVKLWNSYVTCNAQYSNACLPDSDLVRDRAQKELNASEREKLLRQLNKVIYDELPVLPRYYLSNLFGVGPKVKTLNFPSGWVYFAGDPLETAEVNA